MAQKIFITGGTGYIGSLLVEKLLSLGNILHLLYLHEEEIETIPKHENLHFFKGNILNIESLKNALIDCQKVYHLAGYAKNYAPHDKIFYDINFQGTLNLLKAASFHPQIQKILITSSIVTFGPTHQNQIGDENMPRLTQEFFTSYEKSKYDTDQVVKKENDYPFDIVFVHPTRVFGPGKKTEGNSVSQLIDDCRKGKIPILLGSGNSVGNYVYVQDLIHGFIQAMEKGKNKESYILGGENISLKDLFKLIDKLDNKNNIHCPLPSFFVLAFSYWELGRAKFFNHYPLITPGWVKTFLADWAFSCHKAQVEIDYKITPINIALQKTIEWLKSHEK